MSVQVITPQRGHLYWAQMPYLPQRPLDVIQRTGKGESQVILTFKSRPVLVVQNRRDNTNPLYQFVLVAGVHSIKPGEQEKLRRINHPADILLSPGECGLDRPSVVFLNQLFTIHKNLLQDHIGSLPAARLAELNIRLTEALGLLDSRPTSG